MTRHYDVVISGASLAGCAAAIRLADAGAKVALLERRSSLDAYKVLCTHTLQPSCIPVLRELGVMPALDEAGAVSDVTEFWTRWGWIRPRGEEGGDPLPAGLNVRRQTLDSILRRRAAETPGVDLRLGMTVTGVCDSGGHVNGVLAKTDECEYKIEGRLVVGADGRHSTIASLVNAETNTTPNNRFGYFGYFRGLSPTNNDPTRIWFLDPEIAYCIPNEDGISLLAVMPSKDKYLATFKADVDAAYRAFVRSLPDPPPIDDAEQISKLIGTLDYPLQRREPVVAGVALIGDAALVTDPLWGVGCGWALRSAVWLADAVNGAVAGDIAASLAAYRTRHHAELDEYHRMFEDYASARRFTLVERLMFSSAARDGRLARHNYNFGAGLIGAKELLAPSVLARAGAVNIRHGVRSVFRPVPGKISRIQSTEGG